MKKLLLILFLPAAMLLSQTEKDIIGSWQLTNHVASGYNDAYTFNEDGTFTFYYNQMDCAKRDILFSGDWELKERKIRLYVKYNEYYKFGWYEKSSGSCASDSVLVGGIKTIHYYVPFEIIDLAFSDWRIDTEEGLERTMILFNNTRYWHFSKFEYGK